MIHFGLTLQNPWCDKFSVIKVLTGPLGIKDHAWEIELQRTNDIIGIGFGVTFGLSGQHNMAHICLGILGYSVSAAVYNTNHN